MSKKNNKKQVKVSRILYYFWKALMQNKIRTAIILLIIPINSFINSIVMPLGASQMVDQLTTGNYEFENYISIFLLMFIPVALEDLFIIRIVDWLDWSLDAKGGKYLSELAFNKIMNQSMDFHSNNYSGSLISAANKLPNAYINFKSCAIWNILPMVCSLLFIIGTCATVSPIYALGLFVFIVVFATVAIVTFTKTRHIDSVLPEAENKQTGQLSDSISNIINTKSYAREDFERERFCKTTKNTHDATFTIAKLSLTRNFSMNFVKIVSTFFLLLAVINGHAWFGLGAGQIILLFTLTQNANSVLWQINSILRTINRSLSDAETIVRILDQEPSVQDETDKELRIRSSDIDFHNITFQHSDAKKPIFTNFDLKIKAGESIGLVGLSGSGKTTLTKLLLRFADVQDGQILIDGQNIKHITQKSLRENIAYVPQEATLFHRTIAENIAYAHPEATEAEIHRAARLANAESFIKELPQGYNTLVGERGIKLSGGQRQRIAIARAILKDAPILVLDEATSALDSESEALIQDALNNLMKGRTSIVIAHRLSTVANLDRIVVLKNGKIAEQGPHSKLKNANGEYAKLWSRQSGSFFGDKKELTENQD